MIKVIIFDFDGVIVESADIKTEAFRDLFCDYPEMVDEIVDYHLLNAGISRYVKFRHFYEEMLGKELSKDKEDELGRRFSEIVVQKVLEAPFVEGAKEFLSSQSDRYTFFIASGTPQQELDSIVDARGLKGYFKKVCGSPAKKTDIIKDIMAEQGLGKAEVAYIGDAESDRIAAQETGVVYIERDSRLDCALQKGPWRIKDLSSLEEVLTEIGTETIRRSD